MKIAILVLLFTLQAGPKADEHVGKTAKLYFNCNGVLGRIFVHKRHRFKKGDLLASLEYEDVNTAVITAAIYRNKARDEYVSLNAKAEMNRHTSRQNLLKKSSAEVNYEKWIAADQCYYLRADRDGWVVKETVNEGAPVSAGEVILIVK